MMNVAIKSAIAKTLWSIINLGAGKLAPEHLAGSWCVIAPHPDDETLGCGAAIIRAAKTGNKIKVIVLTDGRAAEDKGGLTSGELTKRRETEMIEACARLGIPSTDITFLRCKDGEVGANKTRLTQVLKEHIAAIAPEYIFSPSPIDSHPDHRAGGQIIRTLLTSSAITCPVYEYIVWFSIKDYVTRMLPLVFSKSLKRVAANHVQAQKIEAFKSHVSQSGGKNADAFHVKFWSRYFRPYEIFIENLPLQRERNDRPL